MQRGILIDNARQVRQARYAPWVYFAVPLGALLIQVYLPLFRPLQFVRYIELPLLATIYFAIMRRSQLSGLLIGILLGLAQDSLFYQKIGMYGIAKTIAAVILEALKVAEKVVDIRKKAQEIKAMKLSNLKIAKEIEDAAETEKKKGVASITENVSRVKRKKDTDEGDKVSAFDRAVSKLVDFLEKGGEVDCVLPEEETDGATEEEKPQAGQVRELRATFKEIRLLERRLDQLEDKKPPAST